MCNQNHMSVWLVDLVLTVDLNTVAEDHLECCAVLNILAHVFVDLPSLGSIYHFYFDRFSFDLKNQHGVHLENGATPSKRFGYSISAYKYI